MGYVDYHKKIRSAATWGIIAIVAQIIAQGVTWSLKGDYDPLFAFMALNVPILLSVGTYIAHIRGYFYLGKLINAPLLALGTKAVIASSVFFGVCMVFLATAASLEITSAVSIIQILVMVSTIVFVVTALVFAAGLVMQYSRLGALAIIAVSVMAFPFFIWISWPMVIFLIPSTILLFQQSK